MPPLSSPQSPPSSLRQSSHRIHLCLHFRPCRHCPCSIAEPTEASAPHSGSMGLQSVLSQLLLQGLVPFLHRLEPGQFPRADVHGNLYQFCGCSKDTWVKDARGQNARNARQTLGLCFATSVPPFLSGCIFLASFRYLQRSPLWVFGLFTTKKGEKFMGGAREGRVLHTRIAQILRLSGPRLRLQSP